MKGIRFKYHVLFWAGLIVLSVAVLLPYYYNLVKAILHRLVFVPVWLLATYVNLYWIMPKLWDEGKKGLYLLVISTFILLLTYIQRVFCITYIYPKFFWMRPPSEDELNPLWLEPFVQFAIFILIPVLLSIGIRAGWNWYQESLKANLKIASQQEAELGYLKAQVNPHFLFNTLNNLYGLSLESSTKVPGLILKLSDLLSYSLYESKVDKVTIGKELALVRDFISLEMERYGERIDLDLVVEDSVNLSMEISPLLMLPLVENAFKHGVRNSEIKVPIEIRLSETESFFTFLIQNAVVAEEKEASDSLGGLGLENLRRRLALVYPGLHELRTVKEGSTFIVELKIQLI